jgi:6-pyruvoyltetrahydropterin/6-carboxytetrahydropterin synthase
MYEVRIKTEFSAAHNLREVGGQCESLHGHNFTVEVAVQAETLNEAGMVIDFRLLKEKTRAVLANLDHRYLNQLPVFEKINPSSENLAAFIFRELARELNGPSFQVRSVAVWESRTSQAVFYEHRS